MSCRSPGFLPCCASARYSWFSTMYAAPGQPGDEHALRHPGVVPGQRHELIRHAIAQPDPSRLPKSLPLQGKVDRRRRDGRGRPPVFPRLIPHLDRRAAQRQPLLDQLLQLPREGVLLQHRRHEGIQRVVSLAAVLHAHADAALLAPHQPGQLGAHRLRGVQPVHLTHGPGIVDGRRGHQVPRRVAAPVERLPQKDALVVELAIGGHAVQLKYVLEFLRQPQIAGHLPHPTSPPPNKLLDHI